MYSIRNSQAAGELVRRFVPLLFCSFEDKHTCKLALRNLVNSEKMCSCKINKHGYTAPRRRICVAFVVRLWEQTALALLRTH